MFVYTLGGGPIMTVTTANTQLAYYPQSNFTVLAVPTPIGVSLPSGATLTPVPSELVDKPITYDFEKHVWVDKSDDAQQQQLSNMKTAIEGSNGTIANQAKQIDDLKASLDTANATISTQIKQLANQAILLSTQEDKITALSSQIVSLVMQSANKDIAGAK